MAGFVDVELGIQRNSHQAYVAHEVEQFMACRFVGKIDVGGVEHTVVYFEEALVLVEDLSQALELLGLQFPPPVSKKSISDS